MNRIILIGNGFDLAHGMRTSYGDFINNYWCNLRENVLKECKREIYQDENIRINNLPLANLKYPFNDEDQYNLLLKIGHYKSSKLTFMNKFLEVLTEKKYSFNWVDIENEYYSLLKESYKVSKSNYKITNLKKITKLNEDFTIIESLLESYLSEIQDDFKSHFPNNAEEMSFKRSIEEVIYSDFNIRDFSESSINQITELEFQRVHNTLKSIEDDIISISELNLSKRDLKLYKFLLGDKSKNQRQVIKKLLTSELAPNYFRHTPKEVLFVNFNYTSTEQFYDNPPTDPEEFGKIISTDVIHIHGILNNKTDNKIIFGFGDEIDKDYLEIESLNDNEYLQNIKSIKYLESDSYKRLLEFINSDNYQIFIFGHSCGVSDRTLLNTLFEHKNCASIKPYYRQKDDGTDNYSEMIRNISRNFTDKASMRDRVVNKKYTKALFR